MKEKTTTLVIMAAGIGSRFGKGIKQLTALGPGGEIIMDYSIYDALEAGFNKVCFIIRRDLEVEFKEIIGNRIEKVCEVSYAYQDIHDLPDGFTKPEERTKPWGTGQAVLACKGIVNEPFAVINADDYYGKEAFVKVHNFLIAHYDEQRQYCMAGFILKNTLSESGGVTRGICQANENGFLKKVVETHNIVKTDDGASIKEDDGQLTVLDANAHVSMNMWGLTPEFIDILETGFTDFLKVLAPNDFKSEYLLPTIIDGMIRGNKASVQLLETKDCWFGVTYQEDKEAVAKAFFALTEEGIYPKCLFPDEK